MQRKENLKTIVIIALSLLIEPAIVAPPAPSAVPTITQVEPPRCDARPFRYLVGRTMAEVFNTRFPPNTRIYRVGETPTIGDAGHNRLNIEINNRTRVRRVYCS